jgi:hypothetical protein
MMSKLIASRFRLVPRCISPDILSIVDEILNRCVGHVLARTARENGCDARFAPRFRGRRCVDRDTNSSMPSASTLEEARELLGEEFGHPEFLPGQTEAVSAAISEHDAPAPRSSYALETAS